MMAKMTNYLKTVLDRVVEGEAFGDHLFEAAASLNTENGAGEAIPLLLTLLGPYLDRDRGPPDAVHVSRRLWYLFLGAAFSRIRKWEGGSSIGEIADTEYSKDEDDNGSIQADSKPIVDEGEDKNGLRIEDVDENRQEDVAESGNVSQKVKKDASVEKYAQLKGEGRNNTEYGLLREGLPKRACEEPDLVIRLKKRRVE
jgi:hypothetical protein